MNIKFLYLFSLIGLMPSCAPKEYEKLADGVIIHLPQNNDKQPRQVRLQVVDNRIVRVTATPSDHFSAKKSLIRVEDPSSPGTWTLQEKADSLLLQTDFLTAAVSRKTGEIVFYDTTGKELLRESAQGKSFEPILVEGTPGYSFRQVFESPQDEAFYGLGQHQADEFNYKGKNEELFQYNTKVSVPFVVSNKHYGVLWDNYSLSRFGDKRPYANLDQFRLYDKDGNEGGLTATYLEENGKKVFTTRNESRIDYETIFSNSPLPKNFDFKEESFDKFPPGYRFQNGKIIWEGSIEAPESGLYHFLLYYAGYTTVFVDNKEVVEERWRTAWNPNSYKFTVPLEAGKKVPVRLEWQPDGGASYIGLKALSPLSTEEQNKLAMWCEMGDELDYYFVAGNDMDDVIGGYRRLTGKAPVMPKWAMGFWQSRERYRTSGELLGALQELRNRKFGIDNIVLDWNYWEDDQWGSHKMDPKRFPDPKGMVDSIHDMNARIMISVWPKFYANTDHYKQFEEKGWMYKQAVVDSIRDWVGPGYVGSFYDAYSEGARELFWKQMSDNLYSLGIDAWWMDASEPNVRDCTPLSYRKALCGPTAMGPSTEYFNAYALVNADAIYKGQRKENPNDRVFLLTRSGFAGLQRYSTATWSGDIGTRWEELKAQISAGLNFALSGIPYWTMDIGGFCVENRYVQAQQVFDKTGVENADLKEWRELNARWYQFGTFVPLYRAHGQFPLREIYNIAPENHPAYKSIMYYNKLRYRLMPYIYSLAGKTYLDDYTIMRPLVMDYGKDKVVENISTEYMFGPGLLVCPIYKYQADGREVYFPENEGWYDLYTGAYQKGGEQAFVKAPYERIPIFAPAGAIIPFGPEIQYVNEKKPEEITLYVYGGKDGSFTLYEDEGVNYNYEQGLYSQIPFNYDEASHTLTIGARQGTYPGMLNQRTFNIVLVDRENPKGFDPANKANETVRYDGAETIVKL